MFCVVEDNETNRIVVTLLLQEAGYLVIQAVNGIDALDKMTEEVQVVLMDVHMPILDGVSATRLLLKKRPTLPVVFLTADITDETKQECLGTGAKAVLMKPVGKSLLLSVLNQVLEKGSNPPPVDTSPLELVPLQCLIVDDNSTNRLLAGHLVRKVLGANTEIAFADSGEAAVELASKELI